MKKVTNSYVTPITLNTGFKQMPIKHPHNFVEIFHLCLFLLSLPTYDIILCACRPAPTHQTHNHSARAQGVAKDDHEIAPMVLRFHILSFQRRHQLCQRPRHCFRSSKTTKPPAEPWRTKMPSAIPMAVMMEQKKEKHHLMMRRVATGMLTSSQCSNEQRQPW